MSIIDIDFSVIPLPGPEARAASDAVMITYRRENVTSAYPRTLAYMRALSCALGVAIFSADVADEVIETVDGQRFDAGAIDEIEGDPRPPETQLADDLAAGSWAALAACG